MGSGQSVQVVEDEEEEEEEEDDESEGEEDDDEIDRSDMRETGNLLVKKVLEQEPEMLPCHASASPLSPQLSALGTPRLGPSIKVWDPYNVLAPPPMLPPPSVFSRLGSIDDDRSFTEVFLISHGECDLNLRPDIVGGRCHAAALTPKGKRQARALAVFFNSQGIRFNTVYTSPLDRARSMAVSVCQELNFPEEDIQQSDALAEMSMGEWEGFQRSEIYTADIVSLMETTQPDFHAPAGESLREVEFRMSNFLNATILGLTEKLKSCIPSQHHTNETLVQDHHNDGSSLPSPHSDLLHRHRPGLSRKKSGKSRLQIMKADDDTIHLGGSSPRSSTVSACVGVFTHSDPIKCLLTGLLGCSPVMLHKFCIEDSSVTVLQHSWKSGWQIKSLNDTAHLRLL